MTVLKEHDLIDRYLRPLASEAAPAFKLYDDVAYVDDSWVITTDTMVQDVDFLASMNPGHIAKRLLRINLSDLAGKAAQASYVSLNLCFPLKLGQAFFDDFFKGLTEDLQHFNLQLLGGDLSSAPLMVLSATLWGKDPKHSLRNIEKLEVGDRIYLTGPIGLAYQGLKDLQSGTKYNPDNPCHAAYALPVPRLDVWDRIKPEQVKISTDISDGLIRDLSKIMQHQSGLGAVVQLAHVPHQGDLAQALTWGDDYELLLISNQSLALPCIGQIVKSDKKLALSPDIDLQGQGFSHLF